MFFQHERSENHLVGLIFLVVLGAVMGWLATIILRQSGLNYIKTNIIAGVGGAFLAGLIVNPLFGEGDLLRGGYSVDALLISLIGSLGMLASVNLLRCSEMR